MRPQRVLVTGGSGFIGTNLVEYLLNTGVQVLNFDIKPPANATQRAHWRPVDICEAGSLNEALQEAAPEAVVHLAARTDLNGASVADYPANTTGVQNLINAAATAGVRRVLFASSRLVCRIGYQPSSPTDYLPTTPYGESKVLGEQLVRQAGATGFDWAIVRPTSIWGPWFHVPYRNFFDAVRRGRYLHPRGLRVRKSFGFVGNTVHQVAGLLQAPHEALHRQLFYLADYEPIEVLDWGRRVQAAFGAPPLRELPLPALRVLAGAGDALAWAGWKSVPLTSFRLDNLLTEMLHDTSNLQALCPSLPHGLGEGVAQTVNWMRNTPVHPVRQAPAQLA